VKFKFLQIVLFFSISLNVFSISERKEYLACENCNYSIDDFSSFYDEGGKSNNLNNKYSVTTFNAPEGLFLSLYFENIEIPQDALINVYKGDKALPDNLINSFTKISKTKNIVENTITIEYIPSELNLYTSGWKANFDIIEENIVNNNVARILSQPESDCPFALPLCQNNTVVALGGLYNDLGQIGDDGGDCYGNTGSGGSVWYSFTPLASGPLDFTITPSAGTDYDFVLWDISNGCESNKRVQLSCNYSLYQGATGLNNSLCNNSDGDGTCTECNNQSKGASCSRFNSRVSVVAGKLYAICINFYSGTNGGFTLQFQREAGSVPITDNTPPKITNAFTTNCSNATNFLVKFSEWVDCSTIQNIDFTLAGHSVVVSNSNCTNGRSNQVNITITPALASGTYTINGQNILDLCGNNMNSNFVINIGATPNVTISNPVTFCRTKNAFGAYVNTPGNQTLTASGATSYFWSTGQTSASISISTPTTRTYSVTGVTGSCAAIANVTVPVEVAIANLGNDLVYCGTPLTITALPTGVGYNYKFYRSPVVFPPSNGTLIQSGSSNTLVVSPSSTTTYRVEVISNNGCSAFDDILVRTNISNVQIYVDGNNFCTSAPPILVTTSLPGGTFTGTGMVGNYFYPNIAGLGTHNITYTVTNSCGTFTNNRNIRVAGGTPATIGLNPNYCVTDADINFNITPSCGVTTGNGVTANPCPTRPKFSPATAGVGTHTVTLNTTGIAGYCSMTQDVTVVGAGLVPSINGANGPYCTSASNVTLSAIPTGGTFSGPGMTGNIFSPSSAGVGIHTINYNVVSCGQLYSTSVQIQVNAASPSATISYTTPVCNNSTAVLNVTRTGTPGGKFTASPSGLSIDSITGDILPNLSTPANYIITYKIASIGGCPQFTTTTNISIVASPIVNITSSNAAMCVSDTRILVGTPVGGVFSIVNGPGSYVSATNTLTANGVGTIKIKYKYTVSGCSDSITQDISVNNCGCSNSPILTLNGTNSSTCGINAITITGNTFGGSATDVIITENGAGTVTSSSTNISPFSFTYTPTILDAGNTVRITVQTNNPLGSPCVAQIANFDIQVISPPIAGTDGNTSVCENSGVPIDLFSLISGEQAGGTWSRTGGSGGYLCPCHRKLYPCRRCYHFYF
jgi:hypothetical protein